jgi:hypothetical protein
MVRINAPSICLVGGQFIGLLVILLINIPQDDKNFAPFLLSVFGCPLSAVRFPLF